MHEDADCSVGVNTKNLEVKSRRLSGMEWWPKVGYIESQSIVHSLELPKACRSMYLSERTALHDISENRHPGSCSLYCDRYRKEGCVYSRRRPEGHVENENVW